MATYTGVADSNGDFTIPFTENYTGGQKVTVTAEKDGDSKTIELFAPSDVGGGGFMQISGNTHDFPDNIGNITLSGLTGSIKNSAFQAHANGLVMFSKATGLTIEDGVTSIGSLSFDNWISSKYLIISNSVLSIGNNAFQNWRQCEFLAIPSSLKIIPAGCFQFMERLLNLTLPNTIEEIQGQAFLDCKLISNALIIPNLVKTIGVSAFQGCISIKNVTISSTIQNIANYAFRNCSALEEITVLNPVPPTITSTSFSGIPATCVFKVPVASVDTYKAAPNWSAFESRIFAI